MSINHTFYLWDLNSLGYTQDDLITGPFPVINFGANPGDYITINDDDQRLDDPNTGGLSVGEQGVNSTVASGPMAGQDVITMKSIPVLDSGGVEVGRAHIISIDDNGDGADHDTVEGHYFALDFEPNPSEDYTLGDGTFDEDGGAQYSAFHAGITILSDDSVPVYDAILVNSGMPSNSDTFTFAGGDFASVIEPLVFSGGGGGGAPADHIAVGDSTVIDGVTYQVNSVQLHTATVTHDSGNATTSNVEIKAIEINTPGGVPVTLYIPSDNHGDLTHITDISVTAVDQSIISHSGADISKQNDVTVGPEMHEVLIYDLIQLSGMPNEGDIFTTAQGDLESVEEPISFQTADSNVINVGDAADIDGVLWDVSLVGHYTTNISDEEGHNPTGSYLIELTNPDTLETLTYLIPIELDRVPDNDHVNITQIEFVELFDAPDGWAGATQYFIDTDDTVTLAPGIPFYDLIQMSGPATTGDTMETQTAELIDVTDVMYFDMVDQNQLSDGDTTTINGVVYEVVNQQFLSATITSDSGVNQTGGYTIELAPVGGAGPNLHFTIPMDESVGDDTFHHPNITEIQYDVVIDFEGGIDTPHVDENDKVSLATPPGTPIYDLIQICGMPSSGSVYTTAGGDLIAVTEPLYFNQADPDIIGAGDTVWIGGVEWTVDATHQFQSTFDQDTGLESGGGWIMELSDGNGGVLRYAIPVDAGRDSGFYNHVDITEIDFFHVQPGTIYTLDVDDDNDVTLSLDGIDTDGDGIWNSHDLDDDNDGILDVDEGYVPGPLLTTDSNETFTSTKGTTSSNETDTVDVQGAPVGSGSFTFNFDFFYNGAGGGTTSDNAMSVSYDGVKYLQIVLEAGQTVPTITLSNGATLNVTTLADGSNELSLTIPSTNPDGTLLLQDVTAHPTTDMRNDAFEVGSPNSFSIDYVDQSRDTDGDGIADYLDLDSDNDGISDHLESNPQANGQDPDQNGTIDGAQFSDKDKNGLDDDFQNIVRWGTDPVDSDDDGLADYIDLDSDNDGISDFIEGQATADFVNYDNTDADGDGVIDIMDSSYGFGGSFYTPTNTDGLGAADYLDTDSDEDGLYDLNESGLTSAGTSTNGIDDGSNVTFDDQDGDIATGGTLTDGAVLSNSDSDPSDADWRSTGAPCFTKGTMIQTERGHKLIEDLEEGDLVMTLDHGPQPIRWIGSKIVQAEGNLAPIVIKAKALGNGEDLVVSPLHRMLIDDWRAELMFGEDEVLVAAKHLVNGDTIFAKPGGAVEYFHMMFDQHEIVFAEGCPSESFYPGEVALSALEREIQEEIFTIFPELRADYRAYGPSARMEINAREALLLAA